MRTPRDRSGFRKIHVRPETRRCPACGNELRFFWNAERFVSFVRYRLHIDYHIYTCVNPDCSLERHRFRPEFLTTRVLPKREFGLDVVSLIGYFRLKDCLSVPKITGILVDIHGVEISEREVEDLFNLYVALTTTDVRNDRKLLARLAEQGRIVLTIDAAKPDRDGEALWLIRDHISGEVLLGFTARNIDAEALAEKIREVASLGITIAGVVSDGEPVIVEAVELALPGVPHQLCQYHYLRNFAKEVTSLDSGLKKTLKTDLKGLNRFENAAKATPSNRPKETDIPGPASLTIEAAPAKRRKKKKKGGAPRKYERLRRAMTSSEAQLVRDVCEVARAVLDTGGKPPLETPGLAAYEKLVRLTDVLERVAKKRGLRFSPSSSAAISTGRSSAPATSPRR